MKTMLSKLTSALLCLAMLLTMCSFAMAEAGTYTGVGDSEIGGKGAIEVSVTVDENGVVTDIQVTKNGDTAGIADAAVEAMPGRIMAAQSANVDGVSGATMTSEAIKMAVLDAVTAAGLDTVKWSTYVATEAAKADDATYNTDIVIIGAGGAGMTAALTAAEKGADVIILESQAAVGGNSVRATGGMNAADTPAQDENEFGESAGVEKTLKTARTTYADNVTITKLAEEVEKQWADYQANPVGYFDSDELMELDTMIGGKVVAENFPEGNANFVSYINNAKAANAGVIFSPVSINYAQLIVEAAAAQGFEGTILGGDTLDSNMVVEAAKGKDVDVKITTFYQEGGNPEFDAGIKEWINANADAKTNNGGNDMVSAVTVMGYDAYFTALEAIKAAGSTAPADILAALPGVTYSGISGEISFDDIGDAKRDAAYIKSANTESGEWEFVKVQGIE